MEETKNYGKTIKPEINHNMTNNSKENRDTDPFPTEQNNDN